MSKRFQERSPIRAVRSCERGQVRTQVSPGFGSGGKRSMAVGWAMRAFPNLGQLPEPLRVSGT